MSNQYLVVKFKAMGQEKYLAGSFRWYSIRSLGIGSAFSEANPRRLAEVLRAEHFKRKVLEPGSEPLITEQTYIKGPRGGYYDPFTGNPVDIVPF